MPERLCDRGEWEKQKKRSWWVEKQTSGKKEGREGAGKEGVGGGRVNKRWVGEEGVNKRWAGEEGVGGRKSEQKMGGGGRSGGMEQCV